MSHTPGPWTFFERDSMKYLVGADGQGFAHTVGLLEPRDTANARLIAAAPALLEALEATLPSLESCDVPDLPNEGDVVFWLERRDHALQQARVAIAQAKGQP